MKKLCKYLSYGSLAAVILAMTAATFLEKLKGAETALDTVYHSAWFMVLWGIAAISGIVLLLSRGMSRKAFTVGMHVAFLLILAGALVTHLTGESGSLYLRTGEDATSYEKDNGETGPLDFGMRLESFSIDYYTGTKRPKDYRSEVTLLPEGEHRTISMNHILKKNGYRFYQADYDEDLLGSILAVSHDPWGVGITYAGYILLLVCMVGFFFQKGTASDDQPHRALSGCVPSRLRNFPGRRLGQYFLGQLLGLGSQGDLGADHASGILFRIARKKPEGIPAPQVLPRFLHCSIPFGLDNLFRSQSDPWRNALLRLIDRTLRPFPGVVFAAFGIFRKPALENPFLLGYYFAYAPEAGKCRGAQDGGPQQPRHKQRRDGKRCSYQRQNPPALLAPLILHLYDDGVTHPYDEEHGGSNDNSFKVHCLPFLFAAQR